MDFTSFMCAFMMACALSDVTAEITLNPLTSVYIPHAYTPEPQLKLFKDAAEQVGYDPKNSIAYTIGGSGILQVIDISDPITSHIIHQEIIPGVPNDLDVCGDYVAVSVRDVHTPLPGKVVIFRTYDRVSRIMVKVNEIPAGASPASAVVFTKDCQTVLVANEGEAGKDASGKFLDPEGSITIIKFLSFDLTGEFSVKTADFRKFDERAREYVKRGVRWVYHGERSGRPTKFSQDIEPEWIVLNADETVAYVGLQENNAIATVDIANAEVTEIYPLGTKNWMDSGLDASDRDGGINIQPWQVRGFYQPDSMRIFNHKNNTYIVTANEGDLKSYTEQDEGINWKEAARGKVFAQANIMAEDFPEDLLEALLDEKQLGRLYLSLVDGRENDEDEYHTLYAYGGRSFSIWNTNNMSLVYDSGSDFERHHAEQYPTIFNSHVGKLDHKPEEDVDVRSDDMGPEVEIIETATFGDKTYIFVGNQRVSTIIMYSVEGDEIKPKFEGIFRHGGQNASWQELYEERNIGDINTQDMRFIYPEESPNGKPLLLVSGSVSGTLTVYEVDFGVPLPVFTDELSPLMYNDSMLMRPRKETSNAIYWQTFGVTSVAIAGQMSRKAK